MPAEINFFCEGCTFILRNKTAVRHWIEHCITLNKRKSGVINVIFCKDSFLLNYNKKYLKHNTLTDIITFDYSENKTLSGDIFISIDRLRENSKLLKTSLKDETHRVIIHGVLHLCGYKDKSPSDKARMTQAENKCLSLRTF
ncbi:MAG: Endoribonuclease YbeY [Bacteroidetes bacterium ADurb.Bin141]|nr:Endoribonuclease YbeY [Bacteroidia bacterium]MBX3107360.1 rRNA maturation RNase YbeY [Bacteroidota bacterium]OQB59427.1 MAG: Endoribonuclease YbeY [Bacteroidetes bacterium ADurb.Bin141]MCB8931677.1 rRNA maturation RNase YbeY [Bacteroidia bacterium]MCO5289814.1 rRNA maturation RNase YbeY [Bacteroidota bacterium]